MYECRNSTHFPHLSPQKTGVFDRFTKVNFPNPVGASFALCLQKTDVLEFMADTKFTLLAVDDDHEDLEIFCEAIKEINPSITCLIAYNGREAILLLSELTILPKIIFLDHNMPQMDGKQCLDYLKKDERYKDIPVVIYSTSFSREDIDYFLGAGAFIHQKQVKYNDIMKNLAVTLHSIVQA